MVGGLCFYKETYPLFLCKITYRRIFEKKIEKSDNARGSGLHHHARGVVRHYTWTTHYRDKYLIIFERFFHAFNGLKMHTSMLIKVRKFIQRIDSWNCVLHFCGVHEILYIFLYVPKNHSQGELAHWESALLGCERYLVRTLTWAFLFCTYEVTDNQS